MIPVKKESFPLVFCKIFHTISHLLGDYLGFKLRNKDILIPPSDFLGLSLKT